MRAALFLLSILCAAAASAEEPTVAIPASIADTAVPALSCVRPALPDASKVTAKALKSIEAQIKAYGDCMQLYIDDRHAKSNVYVNLQKAEVDAANGAVRAANAFFAQVRELQNKLRPPPASKGTPP